MNTPVGLLVIGAGWAGLYAAKYGRDAGLDVMILEARDGIGGVWNYSDSPDTITVMRNTVSSSSRHVTEASDFSMGADAGNFFTHGDALLYLRRYADRFGLTERIVTGARVEKARKTDGIWHVETQDGQIFCAERLAIASGLHQKFRPITGPAADFTGNLIHAGEIKQASDLNIGDGDHVVVYGGGETAADIVHDLATHTSADITWAIRDGQHFFRKAPLRPGKAPGEYDRDDMALDEYSSAVLGVLTSAPKGKPGMRHRCNIATSGSVFSYQGHGIGEWVSDAPHFRHFFNKNGHALEHVWNGRVTPARAIERCDADRVTFSSGHQARATHLICTFGYLPDFSYLPETLTDTPTYRLHKLVFHPDDPSLSFFGFARPIILSIPYVVELQCLYAARVWSGAVSLPNTATMKSEAAADAAALDGIFGLGRGNRNIICPFWYLETMMKAMQQDGLRPLMRRFNPFKDWELFSKVIRVPASPLLLRLISSDFGPEERARIDEYISPMPIGFHRDPNVGLLRYIANFGVVIGLSRLLRIDALFDRIARRRMARTGRAISLRPAPCKRGGA